MSLFGNISMLNSALRNFQLGLNIGANNIANAATPGYSRQRVALQPLPPMADAFLQLGTGAMASGVERIRNLFLDAQIKMELSELGRAQARQTYLGELAAIFPEIAAPSATSGLRGAMNDLEAKWLALAAAPGSASAKADVRTSLQNLAQKLNTDSRLLFELQENLDTQVTNTITEINGLLDTIHALNKQVASAASAAQGSQPGSLLDAREQAAQKLAKLVDASFRLGSDGSLNVVFSGGPLVDSQRTYHLKPIPSTTDIGRTGVGYFDRVSGTVTDVTAKILGGKLGGLLQARDVDVEDAMLQLDKMAYGLIQRTNDINIGYVAPDTTTNHKVFTGSKAADIALDLGIVGNAGYIGGTRDAAAPGDLATLQASFQNFIMFSQMQTPRFSNLGTAVIDPDMPLSTQPFSVAPDPGATAGAPRTLVISSGGNTVSVQWHTGQTLNEIIRNINTASGGGFYATFNSGEQKVRIFGNAPLTVYDDTSTYPGANLGKVLMLSSAITSSAPINSGPFKSLNQVNELFPLNMSPNTVNFFTRPYPGVTGTGTVQVDGNNINWDLTQDLSGTITPTLMGGIPPTGYIDAYFDQVLQELQLTKMGDPAFNPAILTPGNPMTAIAVTDVQGNFTRFLNIDTDTNSTRLFEQLVTGIAGKQANEGVQATQAQALVDQTQALQDAESAVNLDEELAQARLFQRSYEASVRLQFIMDEMLNVLINRMGTPSSSGSAL